MEAALRLLTGAIILLSVMVFGSVAHAADPEALSYYEDAVSRFASGDFKGAEIQLKNSLRRDPGQLPAKALLGRAYLALGNPLAAEGELVQAQQLGADQLQVTLPLARARNQLGKFQLNTETIRPTSFPTGLARDLWVELGTARLSSGDTVGAEIAFEEALKLPPPSTAAILGLASVELRRQDHAKVERYCRQALATDPGNPDAWFLMGALEEAQEHLDKALEYYQEALRFKPDHFQAAMGQAIVTMNAGRPTEAAPLFEKILSDRPWHLEAIYLQSQALQRSGQKSEAKAALQRGAELVSMVAPGDLKHSPRLLSLAALVAFETGQYETSFRFLDLYLRYRPDDVAANMRMAELLSRLDKPLAAVDVLTKLANRYPDVANIHVQLGEANSRLGDHTAAAKSFETAISLQTPTVELVSKLGLAQQQQGRTDLAIATMSQLVERAPGANADVSIFLGILYFNEEEFDQAGRLADETVALHPDNLLARNLQAAVAIAQGRNESGRQLLDSILNEDPNFEPAKINLIKLDLTEGRLEEAKHALDGLLASNPESELAAGIHADYALAANAPEQAVQILEQVRERNPRSVKIVLKLADVYLRSGRQDEALATLSSLDAAVPNSFIVKLKLAQVRLARRETDEARSILLDAASLSGSNLPKRLAVVEVQIKAGAFDDATQGLQRAMIERPETLGPKLLMAQVHLRQNRLNLADDLTSKAVAQHPDNLAAVTFLANIRLAGGRTEEAIELYRRGMRISNKPELAISLYRAQITAGQNRPALDELTKWHRQHPGNALVMRVLADHHIGSGQSTEALALYERITTLTPNDAMAHNNLSNLLLPLDGERALLSALRAYELAPKNPAVLDTLGWILVLLGDLEKGLTHLREAVAQNGRVPDIRYHLAVALEEYGNIYAAKEQLQHALNMDGPFPDREAAMQRLNRLESTSYAR